jgi:predicted acetyltransferase
LPTSPSWRYLCAVDWVAEVRAGVRPVDEDLRPQFVNGRVAWQEDRSDHMWVRLLDVPAALEGRRYEVPVQVVLDVHDPYLERSGRFLLDGGPDGATCGRTDQEPDLSLGIDVLGAAYLGGARLEPYAVAGRIDESTPGAVAALDRGMRTSRAPWATTSF